MMMNDRYGINAPGHDNINAIPFLPNIITATNEADRWHTESAVNNNIHKSTYDNGMMFVNSSTESSGMKSNIFTGGSVLPVAKPNKNNERNNSNNKDNSVLFPEGYQPLDIDVLIGRGARVFNHVGNDRLRSIVQSLLGEYSSVMHIKRAKSDIINSIIKRVRHTNNGSFLKQDMCNYGRWFDVGNFIAKEKISQMFRDALGCSRAKGSRKKNTVKSVVNNNNNNNNHGTTNNYNSSFSMNSNTTSHGCKSPRSTVIKELGILMEKKERKGFQHEKQIYLPKETESIQMFKPIAPSSQHCLHLENSNQHNNSFGSNLIEETYIDSSASMLRKMSNKNNHRIEEERLCNSQLSAVNCLQQYIPQDQSVLLNARLTEPMAATENDQTSATVEPPSGTVYSSHHNQVTPSTSLESFSSLEGFRTDGSMDRDGISNDSTNNNKHGNFNQIEEELEELDLSGLGNHDGFSVASEWNETELWWSLVDHKKATGVI